VIKITVKEIEILIEANIQGTIKELKKIVPEIKRQINKIKNEFNNLELKSKVNTIDIKQVKNDVQKAKKQIKEVFNPDDVSRLTINYKKAIMGISEEFKKLEGKKIDLANAFDFARYKSNTFEIPQKIKQNHVTDNGFQKYDTDYIQRYINKGNVDENEEKVNPNNLSMWEILKNKISEAKQMIKDFKNENSNGKENIFSKISSSINKIKPQLNGVSEIILEIKDKIKQWGSGFKGGINHVLKYVATLFSLKSIYSTLSNSASSWLSSQNEQAQQLSVNMEYMKYALGSVFVGAIQYITNLIYNLMRAIQSIIYAFSGVNIFAKATASSMKSTAKSAKDTNKSLAGVHNEINNVSENKNSGSGDSSVSPNMDLSKVSNMSNDILEAIKSGNWYEVGSLIAEKLNEAMDNIPWDKIQNTARNISKGIAQFLNGFFITMNWYQLGNTLAQGINTAIYFAYEFITNFDWKQFGMSIGSLVSSFFTNIDWIIIGQTISKGIIDVFNSFKAFLEEVDWVGIAVSVVAFLTNIDWIGILSSFSDVFFETIATLLGTLGVFIGGLIVEALNGIEEYFQDKIEECGGNLVLGILKGVVDALLGISDWITEHIFQPIIDGFKNAFGIHSPSTVMSELGTYLIQGLFNGINSLVNIISQIWENMKIKVLEIWENIKISITEKIDILKNNVSNILNNISTIWTSIFSSIKTFTTNIFNGIWGFLKGIINNILGGIEGMANGVVKGINTVINAMNKLKFNIPDGVPELGGKTFGFNIPNVNMVSLPRLKTGSVLYEETAFIGGEYSGARSNPEIVSPVSLIYETQKRAIEDSNFGEQSGDMYFTVKVGDNVIGEVCLDSLRRIKRQTGKEIEVLCS